MFLIVCGCAWGEGALEGGEGGWGFRVVAVA